MMQSGSKSNTYGSALEADYAAVASLGHKTGFVTEYDPSTPEGYNVLILTDVRYIPENAVSAIANFMRSGKPVIIDGQKK